jgi:putative membrane-bound dehydrogenase-like protein
MKPSRVLILAFVLGSSSASLAQRIPHAQDRPPGPALSPAEAIKKMTVPPGFTVELVASEPDIVNPVAMTFDERGRVWITESLEYPRFEPGPGGDRIKVLEDTDGDGTMDKFTIFADGLNIPSGIAVGAGGVWVANAPDILFLKDIDGDGKADTREVVVTGFGRYDTHELPNSLTWGPDGYLYGWNGVFNPARIDYRGKRHEFTCAIFRIDPKTRDFEVFCEGTSNPWGITWDHEGSAFASACVIDHLWHLTETGYYHRQGGPYPPFTWKLESIVDHAHQKAAYCGITFFDSDAYPEKYRGRLFMGNIHGNGINVDKIERNGSTYRGHSEPDFLRANDAWFMPVVQKVGPDGSLYILDWYDQYHCYQDARRDPEGIDRLKGRLYRVRYKDTPRAPRFNLAAETDDQLIGRLASPNIFYRELAQRLLRERNHAETRPKLEALALDESARRVSRLHSVWTLVGTGKLGTDFHAKLLGSADPTFRAWGVRAAGNFRDVEPQLREKILTLAHDPSLDVRVQVVIAAPKLAGVDPLPSLAVAVDPGHDDPLLGPIVWRNLLPQLDERGGDFARVVGKADLLEAPGLTALVPRAVEKLLGGGKLQPEPAAALVSKLVSSPLEGATEDAARWALEIAAEALRDGRIAGKAREDFVRVLKQALEPALASGAKSPIAFEAAIVALSWNDPGATQRIRETLGSARPNAEQRLVAATALVAAGDPGVLDAVGRILTDRESGEVEDRGQLLASLGRLDSPRVADVILERYARLEPSLQPKAIELLTQRPAWTLPLLDAVGRKAIPTSVLNVNQVRRLQASKDPAIRDRVRAAWGTVREGRNPAREQVIDRMRTFLKDAQGDALAGSSVFQKVCGQCHKIYGEGQEVGPEVTLNGRGSYEQLLSNVFDPSLVIGTAYQATTVATRSGRTLTGLLVEDSPQRVVLRIQGGAVETIPRAEVEESTLSPLSLMPEGIEAQLSPRELADLFAFITLDKPPTDRGARPIPGTPAGIRK